MGDDVRFDVLGNVWFYLESKDTKLSKRNDINYQMGLFNDYEVSFDLGAIYIPKQKCNELKMRKSNEKGLYVCVYFCTKCMVNWVCKRVSMRSSQLYNRIKL